VVEYGWAYAAAAAALVAATSAPAPLAPLASPPAAAAGAAAPPPPPPAPPAAEWRAVLLWWACDCMPFTTPCAICPITGAALAIDRPKPAIARASSSNESSKVCAGGGDPPAGLCPAAAAERSHLQTGHVLLSLKQGLMQIPWYIWLHANLSTGWPSSSFARQTAQSLCAAASSRDSGTSFNEDSTFSDAGRRARLCGTAPNSLPSGWAATASVNAPFTLLNARSISRRLISMIIGICNGARCTHQLLSLTIR